MVLAKKLIGWGGIQPHILLPVVPAETGSWEGLAYLGAVVPIHPE